MSNTEGMEFFCYHRDRPGSMALRDQLLEEHWSYMDRYAEQMIARGPTLTDGGGTASGSVHIVDLPDAAAARAFAFDEPNYQAGVYRDVLLRRWRNVLGRTMWEFPGGRAGGSRYLVIGLGSGQAADLEPRRGRDELIAYGPLLSDDGATWLGTAVLVRAPDRDSAGAVLTQDRYDGIEVHDWTSGGRRLSAGPFLEHLKIPDRVPMVLPLLLEDHLQALQDGVFFPRVAGATGRDADPLQLSRFRGGDHSAYLVHALAPKLKHLVERRVGVRVDAPATRTGEPRPAQTPRVVRMSDTHHHPPQPAVRGKDEMTLRLHEAPLAVDLLMQDRFGQLPGPHDRPAPEILDHRPGIGQTLRVCRLQLDALRP
jgi:uncharacterized protein